MDVLSPAIIYPELHASLGFGFALAVRFLVPEWLKVWVALAIAVVLVLKETLVDPGPAEHEPFLWSGAQDLGWYAVGAGIGIGLSLAL